MSALPAALPEAPLVDSPSLFGHLARIRHDPLGLLLDTMREGDLQRMWIGPVLIHFAFGPEAVKHVLIDNVGNYRKKTRGYDVLKKVLGEGLVTSEGDHWRRQRRIANPAFHRKAIAGFADTMVTCTQDQVDAWQQSAILAEPIDVSVAMSDLTLRIAGLTLFGLDVSQGGAYSRVGSALSSVQDHFNHLTYSLPITDPLPTPGKFRFRRAVAVLDEAVAQIIATRRKEPDVPDLLGMFMAATDDDGTGMTDRQLRDEVLTMLLAGHETTATALTWTLGLLSRHPDVARRAAAEVDEVLGGRAPTVMDLRDLPYLSRVLNESMRLYPPVWMLGRQAIEDDVVDGYHVPAGSFVYLSQYGTHRNPRYWTNPEGFDPDRFLPERSEGREKYAYFPFSAGQRKCIGDRFAQMEGVLLLAILLQNYEFALVPGQKIVPEPAVTLRPRDGMWMTLARR